MHRVDTSSVAVALPAPEAQGAPGYFSKGDPQTGTPATTPGQDWFNMIQEELIAFLVALGGSPDVSKADYGQLAAAALAYFAPKSQLNGRNALINGSMAVWQRGTSFTCNAGVNTYTADRFIVNPTGANITVAQVSNGISLCPQNKYALRLNGAAGLTDADIIQRIESINALPLKTNVAISLYVENNSGSEQTLNWTIEKANAADDFSAVTTLASGAFAAVANGAEARLTATADLSAQDVANGIQIKVDGFAAFTAGTFDLTGSQIEKGSSATEFESRDYGTELALCQRYCYGQRGENVTLPLCGAAAASSTNDVSSRFIMPVKMRGNFTTFSCSAASHITAMDQNRATWVGFSVSLIDAPSDGHTQHMHFTSQNALTATELMVRYWINNAAGWWWGDCEL